jgi:formate-dependent nitrite reductase membrane component NrfD
MEPKVNGQLQTEWGWWIAVYLFLGGVGSGAYVIGALNGLGVFGGNPEIPLRIALWIGFPALLIGSLCLVADLGSPGRALLAGLKPGTSWIARGFWIITFFMIFSFLHLVLHEFTQVTGGIITVISVLGILFAIGTMAYTGILLSTSKGIPFWTSGVVPMVFVISALVTGHFMIMLCMGLFYESILVVDALKTMAGEAVGVVILEVLVVVFFLQAGHKLPDPRESVERIIRKPFFIYGYVVLGLLVPAVLMALVARSVEASMTAVVIGAFLGLVGGLILRQAILIVGALPTLNIAGFKFRRIARPKEPKPGIGLMPPQ